VIDNLNLYDVEMKTGVLSSNGAITFLTNLLVANSSLDVSVKLSVLYRAWSRTNGCIRWSQEHIQKLYSTFKKEK
jgi:hypothetical protein